MKVCKGFAATAFWGGLICFAGAIPLRGFAQGAVVPDSGWANAAMLGYLLPSEVVRLDFRNEATLPVNLADYQALEELHLGTGSMAVLPPSLGLLRNLKALHLDRTWGLDHTQALAQLSPQQALRHLSLHYCNLTALPSTLFRLRSLRSLNLELNQLGTLPDSLKLLDSLQVLYLGINPKLRTFPGVLLQLPSLTRLYLDQTAIAVLPDAWGQLPNLKVLALNNMPIRSLPPSVGALPNLERLELGGCDSLNWAQALPVVLKARQLRRLNINRADLSRVTLPPNARLSLDTLQAADCRGLHKLLPALLADGNVEYLDVSRSRLDSHEVRMLCRLAKLKYLDLSALDLKSIPEEIQQLPNLHTLLLQYNDLPLEAFHRLQLCPGLRTLRISYGKYEPQELRAIEALLPNVQVLY